MTEIMNGRDLSAKVKMNLKKSVEGLKKVGVTPALAVILVGDDEASKVYVRNKHRAAEKIGIKTIDETMPADSKQEDVIKKRRLLMRSILKKTLTDLILKTWGVCS